MNATDLYAQLEKARAITGRGPTFRARKAKAIASALGQLGAAASRAAADERKAAAAELSAAQQRFAKAEQLEQQARQEYAFAPNIPQAAGRIGPAVKERKAAEQDVIRAAVKAQGAGRKGALQRKAKADAAAGAQAGKATRHKQAPAKRAKRAKLERGGSRENRAALREAIDSGSIVKGYAVVSDDDAEFFYGIMTWTDANGKRRWAMTQRSETREDAQADVSELQGSYGLGASGAAVAIVAVART